MLKTITIPHATNIIATKGKLSESEQLSFLEDFHTRNAGDEAFFSSLTDQHDKLSYDWILNEIERTRTAATTSIMDLGCGDGTLLAKLADKFPDDKLFGLDACEAQLQLAIRRPQLSGRATMFRSTAENIPANAGTVDYVTTHYSLMLFRPLSSAISEIHRILAPTGCVIAALPAPWEKSSKQLPALQAVVTKRMKEILPTFPDVGIVNDESTSIESVTKVFSEAGFAIDLQVKEFTIQGSPQDLLNFAKGLYWYDLYPESNRADFDKELLAALQNSVDSEGRLSWGRTVCLLFARKV